MYQHMTIVIGHIYVRGMHYSTTNIYFRMERVKIFYLLLWTLWFATPIYVKFSKWALGLKSWILYPNSYGSEGRIRVNT